MTRTHPEEYRLAYVVHVLITQMWSNKYSSVSLTMIRNALFQYSNLFPTAEVQSFTSDDQLDSRDYLEFIMGILHLAYKRHHPEAPLLPVPPTWDPANLLKERDRYENDSIIYDLFRWYSGFRIVCDRCHSV